MSGEPLEVLKERKDKAWAEVYRLIEEYPVWRTREQTEEMYHAQTEALEASWQYESTQFWQEYHARNQ